MVDFGVVIIVVVAIFLLFLVIKIFLLVFGFFFVFEAFVHCYFLENLVGYFDIFVFWL